LLRIDLDEESLQKLETVYQVPDNKNMVDYSRFMQDINVVFTTPHLDKDPLGKPVPYKKNTFLDPRDELSEEEE